MYPDPSLTHVAVKMFRTYRSIQGNVPLANKCLLDEVAHYIPGMSAALYFPLFPLANTVSIWYHIQVLGNTKLRSVSVNS